MNKRTNRAIVHVDGDGFFASCEVALNPKLKGKPVVTGQERGIATAMTPEAKKLGISRGMPIYQIRKLYPEAIIINSNYHTYGVFAQRMYDIVRRFTDRVEEYSIDECFADITGLDRPGLSYVDIARSIKNTLNSELGMTFSLGLGPTKVIAKVASKWSKPDGFTVIEPSDIPEFLRDLQIGKIWGVGPSTASEMQRFSIRTALDFVERPLRWVEENLSRPYTETWYELRGTSVYRVHGEANDEMQKSVQATRTFTPLSTDRSFLLSELSRNVEHAASKIRAQGLAARRISYFLKTQEFRYQRFEIPLTSGIESPMHIFDEIKKTFDGVYQYNVEYRATGVTLSGLLPQTQVQSDLFGEVVKKQRWNEIFDTVDEIDRRYGTHTMSLASSLKANTKRGQKPIRHLIIPSMGETQ